MNLTIPEFSLVLLNDPSGLLTSDFTKKFFTSNEVCSIEFCQNIVHDEATPATNQDAFELLCIIVEKRLKNMKLTCVDVSDLSSEQQKRLLFIAKSQCCEVCKIVFQSESKFQNDNKDTIKYQYYLCSEEVCNTQVIRQKLPCNKHELSGPFDIIGDIHGCYDELLSLLETLGYQIHKDSIFSNQSAVSHPSHRQVIFLGDLIDRGPMPLEVLLLVMNMVRYEVALCVPGNHDIKLLQYLNGKNIKINHGLDITLHALKDATSTVRSQIHSFLKSLVCHYVLDDGRLVVAHAGLKQEFHGRAAGKVKSFAYYGDTTGQFDEQGHPIRKNWARHYKGKAKVVYGHTICVEPEWVNNTICIDTGCVFGGKLTALRYPENELVSVLAKNVYCKLSDSS